MDWRDCGNLDRFDKVRSVQKAAETVRDPTVAAGWLGSPGQVQIISEQHDFSSPFSDEVLDFYGRCSKYP